MHVLTGQWVNLTSFGMYLPNIVSLGVKMLRFTHCLGKFSFLLETRLCKRFDKYHVCLGLSTLFFSFQMYICIPLLYFYISQSYFYISNSDFNLFPTLTSECLPLFAFKTPATF